jgi:hypothetical protein
VKYEVIPVFLGYLAKWSQKYTMEEIYHPIESEKLAKYISRLNAKFPDEYLELLHQAGGLTVQDCRVLGISEVFTVSLDDGNYLYLAGKDGQGMIGIKENSMSGELYYIPFDGGEKKSLGLSFKVTIEKVIH